MIGIKQPSAKVLESENIEYLLDIRIRPFDPDCTESMPLDAYDLGALQCISSVWHSWRSWESSKPTQMAYDDLEKEFLHLTGYPAGKVRHYTFREVRGQIMEHLKKFPMFPGQLEQYPEWHKRLKLSLRPRILSYWHEQVKNFLVRQKAYDTSSKKNCRDDPWRHFRHKGYALIYERDLSLAFVIIGHLFIGCRLRPDWIPNEVRERYPEFFTCENNYIRLPIHEMSSLLESLWEMIERNLKEQEIWDIKDSQSKIDGDITPLINSMADIWEDISPEYKVAIQEYQEHAKQFKAQGKRLMISKFCQEQEWDETIFRTEYDKVRTRRKRSLKQNK